VETHGGNTSCLDSVYSALAKANGPGGAVTLVPGLPSVTSNDTSGFAAAAAAAAAADAVVLVLGNDESVEGEMRDRTSIDLPGAQHALVAAVTAAAAGKPVVIVLLSGSTVDVTAERDAPGVGAMVFAGYPGTWGGWAVAATLYGANDRLGGKLATTWYPASYTSAINMSEMELDVGPGRGYRFYAGPTVFPFGFGLSLTTFDYAPAASWPSGDDAARTLVTAASPAASPQRVLTYTVNVTNSGAVTGDDVVFLFVEPGQRAAARRGAGRLLKQLLDYRRVHLAPGESATVSFDVSAASLALHDRATGDKVATPGEYTVVVTNGAGARLAQAVTVAGDDAVLERFPRF
jgi:xylan 1,4-beta-xylosidase